MNETFYGDMVQVINGKYKGEKGKVEKTGGSCHQGDYVTVNVAGELKVYGALAIFLIERLTKLEEKPRSENIAEPGKQDERLSRDLKAN